MIIILVIILLVLAFTNPGIDSYTDYRGIKRIILWYTTFKGERKFINILGSQE